MASSKTSKAPKATKTCKAPKAKKTSKVRKAKNTMTTLIRIEYTDTSNENLPVIDYDVLTSATSIEQFEKLVHNAVTEWRNLKYKESFTEAAERVFF